MREKIVQKEPPVVIIHTHDRPKIMIFKVQWNNKLKVINIFQRLKTFHGDECSNGQNRSCNF
jgi:hypothetical protein